MGPHRKQCNKIDWLTQTLCFEIQENKPKQMIRVPAIKVCEPVRLKNCGDGHLSLLVQHATKTQTSLRKCARNNHNDTHKVGE